MSLPAMVWALYDVELDDTVDALAKLVLIAIADQTDSRGRGAITSRKYLASATGLGESTCADRVRRLERAGLIFEGDTQLVAHLRYKPNVWDLAMPRRRKLRARKGARRRPLEGTGGDPLDGAAAGGREGVARGSRGGRLRDDTPSHPHTPAPGVPGGAQATPPGDAGRGRLPEDIARMRAATRRGGTGQ